MQQENRPTGDLVANDIEFHRILARASYNTISERIYNFVIDVLETSIRISHEHNPKSDIAYNVHKNILDAIESKNINTVREAIDHSVDAWTYLQDSND